MVDKYKLKDTSSLSTVKRIYAFAFNKAIILATMKN